ncbi:MAG: C4-dicarboxylate ABC transporter, partial [Deltaproteobacteria bacterium]|nr:C4-dicarboxylate ABC transporter [Deltaproteobacteria bacterium]
MANNTARQSWLENLYPGYYTLTMATGIIGVAMHLLGLPVVGDQFYMLTIISWCVLTLIYTVRLVCFPKAVLNDLMNPRLTFNFFTFVAGTSVAGLLLDLHGHHLLTLLCWVVAFLAWVILLYFSFSVLMLLHGERNVNVVDGGWLICIVGTESLVLLGLKTIPYIGDYDASMMLAIFMLWGVGLILYGIFVALFCYRIFFMEMKAEDFTPQMWVIMGAAAICANASSGLDMADPVLVVIAEVHAFIDSVALLSWAWATWWIPLLVIISFWKHVIKKVPLRYDPRQWSVVFPLGMYTVASVQLSLASEVDALHEISHIMIWAAIALWSLMMLALLRRISF